MVWIPTLTQIALEYVVLVFLWRVALMDVLYRVERWTRTTTWYAAASKRSGMFCLSGQDDIPITIYVTIHHTIAGSLVMLTIITGDSKWLVHGILGELANESIDLVLNLISAYPYSDGRVSSVLRLSFIAHHVPTTALIVPFLRHGLHANVHLQHIAANLLFGGACLLWLQGTEHSG
jgi:hypothetical protein